MPSSIALTDETMDGRTLRTWTMDFPTERIAVRELIRSRVQQEVDDFNARRPEVFAGLVQPEQSEPMRGGCRVRRGHTIDWREQFDCALDAFKRNEVLILVGDRQMTNLDEEIVLAPGTSATFLRLVPLVGG